MPEVQRSVCYGVGVKESYTALQGKMIDAKKKEMIEVTAEHIQELRYRGETWAADRLLRAHQESLQKNWKVGRVMTRRVINAIRVVQHRRLGLCVSCSGEAVKNRVRCESCVERHRIAARISSRKVVLSPEQILGRRKSQREYERRNRERFREKYSARRKKWYAENREKILETNRRYYFENKEEISARDKLQRLLKKDDKET